MAERPLRLGMIGIGVGASFVLHGADRTDAVEIFAGADIDPTSRDRFATRYPEARVYDTADELVSDPDVEAVWIATPNRFHCPHTVLAAEHGKHVVIEKPMALDLKEASAMIEACQRNGVKLLAGHTRSFGAPIRLMRQIVHSGRLGALGAVNCFAYHDWVIHPRTAEELDPNQGGGIVYRQIPHQVDSIRSIGSGKLRSVRGTYGQWMKERPIPGYYAVFMEFENGVPAVAIQNGYGYFVTSELVPWGDSVTNYTLAERNELKRQMRAGSRPEDAEKLEWRGRGPEGRKGRRRPGGRPRWKPGDMGIIVVSCERGDLRQSPYGVYVYDDDGLKELRVDISGGQSGELLEIYNAVRFGKPVYHSGEWGMATLEVVMAIYESSKTHKDVLLTHQVEMPAGYDKDYPVVVEEEVTIEA